MKIRFALLCAIVASTIGCERSQTHRQKFSQEDRDMYYADSAQFYNMIVTRDSLDSLVNTTLYQAPMVVPHMEELSKGLDSAFFASWKDEERSPLMLCLKQFKDEDGEAGRTAVLGLSIKSMSDSLVGEYITLKKDTSLVADDVNHPFYFVMVADVENAQEGDTLTFSLDGKVGKKVVISSEEVESIVGIKSVYRYKDLWLEYDQEISFLREKWGGQLR